MASALGGRGEFLRGRHAVRGMPVDDQVDRPNRVMGQPLAEIDERGISLASLGRLAVQTQRGGHIFVHCPDPQRLQGLTKLVVSKSTKSRVIQAAAM
jgi:hypothetical protein